MANVNITGSQIIENVHGLSTIYQDVAKPNISTDEQIQLSVLLQDISRKGRMTVSLENNNNEVVSSKDFLIQDIAPGSQFSGSVQLQFTSGASGSDLEGDPSVIRWLVNEADFSEGQMRIQVMGKLGPVMVGLQTSDFMQGTYQANFSGNGVYDIVIPFTVA